eukprot:5059392-Prymnesium_polylepis.1
MGSAQLDGPSPRKVETGSARRPRYVAQNSSVFTLGLRLAASCRRAVVCAQDPKGKAISPIVRDCAPQVLPYRHAVNIGVQKISFDEVQFAHHLARQLWPGPTGCILSI